MGRLLVAVSLVALAASHVGCASREPPLFQLDWQVVSERGGPAVKGHVVNRASLPARDLRLLVEGLDDSGRVVTKTLGVLAQMVESGGSTPFDVPVPGTAATYRVSVLSYQLVLPPASTGRSR